MGMGVGLVETAAFVVLICSAVDETRAWLGCAYLVADAAVVGDLASSAAAFVLELVEGGGDVCLRWASTWAMADAGMRDLA